MGSKPTLGGFTSFVFGPMGVPNTALSQTDPSLNWAFSAAMDIVNQFLCVVPSVAGAWSVYERAVYYLAADNLINLAQDGDGPVYKNNLQYFAYLRAMYQINNFVAGVVQSTSDEGTSSSYMVPDGFKEYTIANLQNLKTPYGRAYLGIAQSWGSQWGLS